MKTIGWITLAVCMLVWTLGFIVAILSSKRIYDPIYRLYQSALDVQERNVNNGKGEIEFIGKTINILKQKQENMSKDIMIYLNQLKVFFLISLFKGQVSCDEFENKKHFYRFLDSWEWMSILVFQIDTLAGSAFNEYDFDLVMCVVNDILEKVIPSENRVNIINIDNYLATILGGNHKNLRDIKRYITEQATLVQKTMRNNFNLKISVGVSRPFNSYKDISIGYKQAREALKYRIKFENESLLFIQDFEQYENLNSSKTVFLKDQVIEAVKIGDLSAARNSLHDYIVEIVRENRSIFQCSISFIGLHAFTACDEK